MGRSIWNRAKVDSYAFQTPRVWGGVEIQFNNAKLELFQTPRVWGGAEEVAFLVEAWEFQTPRVWGGVRHVNTLDLEDEVSDPTRVGRGGMAIKKIRPVGISDPTRVGRGDALECEINRNVFRPHACGEGMALVAAYQAAKSFQTPRVWGGEYTLSTNVGTMTFRPHACGEGTRLSVSSRRAFAFRPHACGEEHLVIYTVQAAKFQTPRVWGGRPGTCVPGHGQDTCDFQQRIPRHARVASATGHQTPRVWGGGPGRQGSGTR